MENLWVSDGEPPLWRAYRDAPIGAGFLIRLLCYKAGAPTGLGSCTPSLVVLPTEGRELRQAEKEGTGEEKEHAASHQQADSYKHRSFQEDKDRVSTDHRQPYSTTNQSR
jgi:hypothetical protein